MGSVVETVSIGERKCSDPAFVLGIALQVKQQKLRHSFKSSQINKTRLKPALDSLFLT